MPGFDDRLTRELERAARPAAPDVVRAFEEITRRRAKRAVLRKVQVVAVVGALLAGTAGAFVALDDRFDANQVASSPEPATLQWRQVVEVGRTSDLTCDPSTCTLDLLSADTIVLAGRDELVGDTDVAYTLGDLIADGTDVATAELVPFPTQPELPYSVVVTLDEDATERLSRASARASQGEPPVDQLAVVWDGEVLSGPTFAQPVPATSLQLSFATQEEAQALLDALGVPAPEPTGRDVGLPFRMCRVRQLTDLDLGGGSLATALVGGRVDGDICPDEYDGTTVLAVDVEGDGRADTWTRLPRCLWCEPVGTIGTELVVLLQGGSTPEYGLYRLDAASAIVPLRMSAPADPDWGFAEGEPVTIWTGGDEGYSYWVACTGDPAAPTLVVTQSVVPVDTPVGSTYVRHTTRLTWDAEGASVLDTSDQELTLGQGAPAPPSGGCPIELDPLG